MSTVRDTAGAAASGLRVRPLRSALSALGVAIGVASLVAVLGLSGSSRADLLAALDRLGTNLLTVAPGQTLFGEETTLPEEAEEMVGRIAAVRRAAAATDVQASVRRTDLVPSEETNGLRVRAVDTTLLETIEGSMAEGRFLDAATESLPAVVLGSVAAERLGVVGRAGSVRVYIGGRWFSVIGVMDTLPLAPDLDRAALIGRPMAIDAFDAPVSASTIYVRADPEDVPVVRDLLAATANPIHPEEVAVERPSDAIAARAAAKTAFTTLFLGLGAVALVVGAIGIVNVMVIAVLERRNEIGLRRALGATRSHVRAQFLAESLVLSSAGGVAGIVLGVAATVVYAFTRGWTPVVPPAAIAGGSAAAILVGALAGIYPASRAARLSPSEALRST